MGCFRSSCNVSRASIALAQVIRVWSSQDGFYQGHRDSRACAQGRVSSPTIWSTRGAEYWRILCSGMTMWRRSRKNLPGSGDVWFTDGSKTDSGTLRILSTAARTKGAHSSHQRDTSQFFNPRFTSSSGVSKGLKNLTLRTGASASVLTARQL